ncbi:MAG TPA: hypothetical protein VNH53_08695 [Sphingomicrobium sp.]|jgi:hypothetical protein|nr:hypothetical protein [Sphingomicrobium sp.]
MRSHSGKDEARNNLHDPTLRDRELRPKREKAPVDEPSGTTEMGSGARKSGQQGAD